ncbi:hypothetical protein B0O80DRAFT_103490 [Mortierella sp. GBAus27b]|nr:hypothetical protein B0O80DRAFT_103490 [Mortierella sp. GBAus27b]
MQHGQLFPEEQKKKDIPGTELFYTISYSREMKKSRWYHEASKLPHSEYFRQQEDTRLFDHVGFLRFLQPSTKDRDRLSNLWNNDVISSLLSSTTQTLRDAGNRLKAEWTSKAAERERFWEGIKEEELKKQKENRMSRLKAKGERRLQAAEEYLVEETRLEFAHETERLRSASRQVGEKAEASKRKNPGHGQVSPSNPSCEAPSSSETTTQHDDLFILPSQFDSEDGVDKFFFDHPTSAWNDLREFCLSMFQRKCSMSSKKAYQRYTKSLQAVRDNTAVGDEVREHASKALATREAAFRSAYFEVDNRMQQHAATNRKHDLEEAGEEAPSYLALHSDIETNEALDDLDGDFEPNNTSETASTATQDQDLTGEIPEPMVIDRLVGPGDFSSHVTAKGQRIINNCNITTTLMKHRRGVLRTPYIATVDDLLLTNFVVSQSILLKLFSEEITDEAFPSHRPVALAPEESSLVRQLSTLSTLSSYEKLQEWFGQQPSLRSSIVYRTMSLYFLEAGLWSDCNWFRKGTGDNEDTFTDNLIKPLMSGTFGDLAGCSFRW